MPGPDYTLHPDGWLETETASFTRGAAIVFGGLVYLFDGVAGEVYDPDADTFTALPSNGGTFGFYVAAAAVGTVAYVFVATTNNGDHQTLIDVHRLDLTTDTWLADGATLARGVQDDLGCAAIGTDVYLPGIMDDGAPGLGDYEQLALWEYDTVGDAWTKRANASVKGVSSAVAVLADGLLHVFGGYFSDVGNHLADHQIWDPGTDTWSAGTALPDTRSLTNCAVMDGEAFLSGFRRGSSDSNFRDDLIYNLDDDAWRLGAAARGHTDRPVVALDDGLHVFAAGTSFQRHDFLSTLTVPEPDPDLVGAGREPDLVAGSPEHVIVSDTGAAVYPIVGDWVARERANGGWIGATAQVSADLARDFPDVVKQDSQWITYIRETGDVLFSGRLKEPPLAKGVIDISCDGPASRAEREVERLLYRSDGPAGWVPIRDELYNLRPLEAPTTGAVVTGQASGMGGGTYKWGVTFVSGGGSFESALGPVVELALDPLGATDYHVTIEDIPRGPEGVTARKLYRLDPTGPAWKLVATIADNTTETHLDTVDDATGGATPPATRDAAAIDVVVDKGSIEISVPADGVVLEDQRAGAGFPAPTQPLSRFVATFHPNRALANYEVEVVTSDGARGAETVEEVFVVPEESVRMDVPLTSGGDHLQLRLRRTADGSDADAVRIIFDDLQVYGETDDEGFTATDVVRDVFSRLHVSELLVRETGRPILPLDFQLTTYAEVLDLMALLSNRRWLIHRRGSRVAADFREYDARVWNLSSEDAVVDLVPEPRASRVRIPWKFKNGVAVEYAEATADPNLLGRIVTAPPLPVEVPGGEEQALALAQALADWLVQPHWSGTVTFFRVRDDAGAFQHCHHVKAGSTLVVPGIGGLAIEQLERRHESAVAQFPTGIPLLDRYNARRQKRAAIA